MDLLKIKPDVKAEIEKDLWQQIDACMVARGTIKDTWDRNVDIYNMKEGVCNATTIEGLVSYAIPLAPPIIDRVVDNVMDQLAGMYPYVQCLTPGDDGTNDDSAENLLHQMALTGGFISAMTKAVLYAALTNLGIVRIVPDPKKGTDWQWIHPKQLVVYPAEFGSLAEAKTVGHKATMLLYRIQAKQAGKTPEFYAGDLMNDGEQPEWKEHEQAFNKTSATPPAKPKDGPVEIAYLLTEDDYDLVGEGKMLECVYAIKSRKLLSAKEYQLPKINYHDVRLYDPEGEIFMRRSLAWLLQGLQLAYSDIWTFFVQGSLQTAFPIIYETGGTMGVKTTHYGPAQIRSSSEPVQVQSVNPHMNAQEIPALLNKLEERAAATSYISNLGQSANLPAGTTATAAAGFLQAQQEGKNAYSRAVAPSIAAMWGTIWEIYKLWPQDILNVLGKKVQQVDPNSEFMFEVTGESGSSNPQLLLQKLTTLLQMAMQPQTSLDYQKCEGKYVELLDFPWPVNAIKKDGPSPDELKAMLMGLLTGEMSDEEVAQMMGVTPQMLMQLHQAHQQMHGTLLGSGGVPTPQGPNDGPPEGGVPAVPQGPTPPPTPAMASA